MPGIPHVSRAALGRYAYVRKEIDESSRLAPVNCGPSIRLFLCGDVMTGRGIDQILPAPGDPRLYESYIRDARDYVRLAECVNGPIPIPVDFSYIWGDAIDELREVDARVINLETSVTRSEDYWPCKEVLYRMHPGNIGCLTAARIDCCCLANNHVLDWGYAGLAETLGTLDAAGIARTGAGRDLTEAKAPAVLDIPDKGRVLVFSIGSATSGIPRRWGASAACPGVNLLADLSRASARCAIDQICPWKRAGDVLVVSVHWGPNWGYEIPDEQIEFAHELIDGGTDIVHGHSSHHVKAIEVYRERLILYGCGDLITDYEGISGHEQFRGDLGVLYLVNVDAQRGQFINARLVPMQMNRLRLRRASETDGKWLCDILNQFGRDFGATADFQADHTILVNPISTLGGPALSG